eukprot:scaffold50167_cov51-Attheya_sp.AAC.2
MYQFSEETTVRGFSRIGLNVAGGLRGLRSLPRQEFFYGSLGSGERAEGCVRRGFFYLEKSGCVPARVDVVQRWRP